MNECDIGLIGLAVMGRNLALNMERNGYRVAVYNRSWDRTGSFLEGPGAGKKFTPCRTLEEMISVLRRPRLIMMMVKAGRAVDDVTGRLLDLADPGDVVMDGGNALFHDTERRIRRAEERGVLFLGVGISGGEEGALWGPSIMPGGDRRGYDLMEPILGSVAAKVDGTPCVTYIGPGGSGHFVKMVHNGIEYADMQVLAEAYDLMHRGLGLSAAALHEVFSKWNEGPLSSYLTEITAHIFAHVEKEAEQALVELILDEAQQKATGRWTSQTASELGVPIPTIGAGVEGRIMSSFKKERIAAGSLLRGPDPGFRGDRDTFLDDLGEAVFAARICSYAQGFAMLSAARNGYGYGLRLHEIARIWRGGCIIRARLLKEVQAGYEQDPALSNLMLAPFFREALSLRQAQLRTVLREALDMGIPMPAMCSALAYYDTYRTPRLPANLTQAQRDYFGAHTYRRVDREGVFHTEWNKGS